MACSHQLNLGRPTLFILYDLNLSVCLSIHMSVIGSCASLLITVNFYNKRSTLFLIIFTNWDDEFWGSVPIAVLFYCSVCCAEYVFVCVGSVYIRGSDF